MPTGTASQEIAMRRLTTNTKVTNASFTVFLINICDDMGKVPLHCGKKSPQLSHIVHSLSYVFLGVLSSPLSV